MDVVPNVPCKKIAEALGISVSALILITSYLDSILTQSVPEQLSQKRVKTAKCRKAGLIHMEWTAHLSVVL